MVIDKKTALNSIGRKVASILMFLKGAVRLKKGPTRLTKTGSPWVFSNELASVDKKIEPGAWVALEDAAGKAIGYGYFNPHSLIAFRLFERASFRSEEQTRALFFKRLDAAWRTRTRAYAQRIAAGEIGAKSFRLAFGESDGVPGLIIDLYEAAARGNGMAVLQCHAAGADNFIFWAQQWLEERMAIGCGVVRNDLDVRKREHVALEVSEWGQLPDSIWALEGGVRFFVDPRKGQKTGYFYDHRDNRAELARRAASSEGDILDCFSYVGGWGLQALKKSAKGKLLAVDVSRAALERVERNAAENGLRDRVETLEVDLFKEKKALGARKFAVVVSDPPALTSSAKQAAEGRRAHEACFATALAHLESGGIAALASCSFHLTWDDFISCVSRAGWDALSKQLKLTYVGSQGADHPILSSLPETRYLKAVIVEEFGH